jgi:hypothetical protein
MCRGRMAGRAIRGRLPFAMAAAVIAGLGLAASPASAATGSAPLIDEPFTGASVAGANWVTGGTSGLLSQPEAALPCLTGSTAVQPPITGCPPGQVGIHPGADAPGTGALRLTDNRTFEAAFALDHEARPFSVALAVDFDFFMYANASLINSPADGIAFFLADGTAAINTPGAEGGGLGYAPIGGIHGLPGAYMGIGFDQLGNFEQSLTDGSGCTPPPPTGVFPQPRVGIRGPGNGTTGYCLEATSGALPGELGVPRATSRSTAGVRRHAHIDIDNPAAPNPRVAISIDFGAGLLAVLTAPLPSNPPATFQLGFSGGTGVDDSIHEISNVRVSSVVGSTVLTLQKTHQGSFKPGGTGTFTLTAAIASSGAPESQPVTVIDHLPSGLTVAAIPAGSGWDCSATVVGTSTASCTNKSGATAPIAAGTTLPAITLSVAVAMSATGSLLNTATAYSADATASVRASDPAQIDSGSLLLPLLIGLAAILAIGAVLGARSRSRRRRARRDRTA